MFLVHREREVTKMIRAGRPLFGNREHGVFELLGNFEPGLMVDVGAAAGHLTSLALRFMPQGSYSVGFEPFPGNWQFYERTLANKPARLVRAAVSDKEGEVHFYVGSTVPDGGWAGLSGYSSVGYITKAGATDPTKTIISPITTIDAHIDEPIRFMKIDVQGEELGVLKGATKCFERGIDLLHVEFSGEGDILDFLLDRDYVIFDHHYMSVPQGDAPDLSMWDIDREVTLSTGAKALFLWPKVTPSDPQEFAAMFRKPNPTLSPPQTDIIAVRTPLAKQVGWID